MSDKKWSKQNKCHRTNWAIFFGTGFAVHLVNICIIRRYRVIWIGLQNSALYFPSDMRTRILLVKVVTICITSLILHRSTQHPIERLCIFFDMQFLWVIWRKGVNKSIENLTQKTYREHLALGLMCWPTKWSIICIHRFLPCYYRANHSIGKEKRISGGRVYYNGFRRNKTWSTIENHVHWSPPGTGERAAAQA
jgi:hypothetical protein